MEIVVIGVVIGPIRRFGSGRDESRPYWLINLINLINLIILINL